MEALEGCILGACTVSLVGFVRHDTPSNRYATKLVDMPDVRKYFRKLRCGVGQDQKGSGMAMGIAIGAGIGVALQNLPIGIAIGVAIGAALEQGQKDKEE